MSTLHFTPIITDHVLSTSCDLVQLLLTKKSSNCSNYSLRKHPFLLARRRWGRYARNVPGGEERETDVFAGYSN